MCYGTRWVLLHAPPASLLPLAATLSWVLQIYNAQLDAIQVAPFRLWADTERLTNFLSSSDEEILAATSTSPETEDDRFVDDVRQHMTFVLQHAGPDGMGWWQSVFGGGMGHTLVFPRVGCRCNKLPGQRANQATALCRDAGHRRPNTAASVNEHC